VPPDDPASAPEEPELDPDALVPLDELLPDALVPEPLDPDDVDADPEELPEADPEDAADPEEPELDEEDVDDADPDVEPLDPPLDDPPLEAPASPPKLVESPPHADRTVTPTQTPNTHTRPASPLIETSFPLGEHHATAKRPLLSSIYVSHCLCVRAALRYFQWSGLARKCALSCHLRIQATQGT